MAQGCCCCCCGHDDTLGKVGFAGCDGGQQSSAVIECSQNKLETENNYLSGIVDNVDIDGVADEHGRKTHHGNEDQRVAMSTHLQLQQ